MKNSKLVVIVGETASGKSSLALKLARRFNGEVIAADSWTVYRGFNIGTAKPDKSDQEVTRHHLLDIADPQKGFSAAIYKDMANKTIEAVGKKGKLPIMVGGTGLYVDAVLYDFSFLPIGSAKEREILNQKTIPELLKIINKKKYDLAEIDINNKRRLVRLIESKGARPKQKNLRSQTLVMGLKPPRSILRANIERRVDNMFRSGLKTEVEQLVKTYGWEVEPMKGIGYREFRGYFDGQYSLAETKRKIVRSSLGLAKKQRTWFKRHPEIVWLSQPEAAEPLVKRFLSSV